MSQFGSVDMLDVVTDGEDDSMQLLKLTDETVPDLQCG